MGRSVKKRRRGTPKVSFKPKGRGRQTYNRWSKFNGLKQHYTDDTIKEKWDVNLTYRQNMAKLGVAIDANPHLSKDTAPHVAVKQPATTVKEYTSLFGSVDKDGNPIGGRTGEDMISHQPMDLQMNFDKSFVIPEAGPSWCERNPMTEDMQMYIVKCMDYHGLNYKKMFKDIKGVNELQFVETKLKSMAEKFLSLPEDKLKVRLPLPERVQALRDEAVKKKEVDSKKRSDKKKKKSVKKKKKKAKAEK